MAHLFELVGYALRGQGAEILALFVDFFRNSVCVLNYVCHLKKKASGEGANLVALRHYP